MNDRCPCLPHLLHQKPQDHSKWDPEPTQPHWNAEIQQGVPARLLWAPLWATVNRLLAFVFLCFLTCGNIWIQPRLPGDVPVLCQHRNLGIIVRKYLWSQESLCSFGEAFIFPSTKTQCYLSLLLYVSHTSADLSLYSHTSADLSLCPTSCSPGSSPAGAAQPDQ